MARLSALTVRPGNVVVADFPGVRETKRRPALVASTDAYHRARPDVILAVLTGNLAAATTSMDYHLQDWAAAGLHHPTAFRAFLITLPREDLVHVIGHLSDRDWDEVQTRLLQAVAVN